MQCMKLRKTDRRCLLTFISVVTRPNIAEFQQDRLDQMLYGFLQFPYQETHAD
jgi:hypothetical protein